MEPIDMLTVLVTQRLPDTGVPVAERRSLSAYDSCCHYNPTAYDMETVDLNQDCMQAARWHVLASVKGQQFFYQACDRHLGYALRMRGVESYHEFGAMCGRDRTVWLRADNVCVAVEMGQGI